MTKPSVHVILVHGTGATKAEWVTCRSPMWAALVEHGCEPERFAWSGQNSHHARDVAADELARLLSDPSRSGIPQAIVAHSHGGNIAIHAVARSHKTQKEIPVVTLATPFILAARKRVFSPSQLWAGLTILAALVAGVWATIDIRQWDAAWWITVALIAAAVLAAILVASGVALICRTGPIWRKDRQSSYLAKLEAPEVQVGLLVVRAAGDEATGLLTVGQFTA